MKKSLIQRLNAGQYPFNRPAAAGRSLMTRSEKSSQIGQSPDTPKKQNNHKIKAESCTANANCLIKPNENVTKSASHLEQNRDAAQDYEFNYYKSQQFLWLAMS